MDQKVRTISVSEPTLKRLKKEFGTDTAKFLSDLAHIAQNFEQTEKCLKTEDILTIASGETFRLTASMVDHMLRPPCLFCMAMLKLIPNRPDKPLPAFPSNFRV